MFKKKSKNSLPDSSGFENFNKGYSKKVITLDENEADLSTFINSLADPVILIDKDFKIVLCNNSLLQKHTKTEDEIIGVHLFSILEPPMVKHWEKQIKSAFDTGSPIAFEDFREGRSFINSINPIKDNDGKVSKAAIISIGITEKMDAEIKLKESEANYRSLFENLPIGIGIISEEGKIVSANDRAFKLLGYEKNDLNWLTTQHLYSNPSEKDTILKKIAEGTLVRNYEVKVRKKDGSEFYILSTITPIKYSDKNSFLIVFDDITSRKASEEKILKLSKAVEQSPISIIITDTNGKIEYVNKKFIETSGYNIDDVIGKEPLELPNTDSSDEFCMKLWEVIGSGREWKGELLHRFKNKKPSWESVSISPIRNGEGQIKYYLAVKEDITERKIIEQDLKFAKESAEQSNKLKDAFISNLSHEIRTPLNGLLGFANLIKEINFPNLSKEDEELFEGINSTGKRLIRTMDMILNYSRLEVGEYRWNFSTIDLSILIKDLVSEFSDMARSKQIELLFENRSRSTLVSADGYSLESAISNLIDNAIKYTVKGFVKLILYNNKSDIFLEVKDSGIGIDRNFLEHIFEPYSQEDSGYSRAYEGLGLGLSLTKKLLNLNDASISLTSEKNVGTTFTIRFNKIN